MLVSTDYFTKCVKTKPLANIKDVDAKRFVWKNIVTWFGIPHTLILDNDLQLIARPLGAIVMTWELRIGIPPQPIHKGMDKLRLSIRS